jgi:hypothetical protein
MVAEGLGHVPSQMVSKLEAALGVKFPPGYNPGLAFMSHLWEDLQASYRPLVFYLGMELLAVVGVCLMRMMGFKKSHLR